MREVNLRAVDLNLLVVLQVLLQERHVSRAAVKLNMSQPAVSRALQRLRDTLADPLLVRTREGYDLSARAREMVPRLDVLLHGASLLIQPPRFDPETATDTLRLAGLDLEMALYLPRLTKKLHQEAPHLKIELVPQTELHFHKLDMGEVHFSLTGLEPEFSSDQFHRSPVDSMTAVCLMDTQNSLADGMTLDQYVNCQHGMVSITGKGPGMMDEALGQLGLARKLSLRLSSFMSVADFCEGTDLVFVLPERLAEHIARGRNLVTRPLPEGIKRPDIRFFLYWHARFHHDPMCLWVRDKIAKVLGKQALTTNRRS
ncbi:MAG: LysR family transcriptional regulator [Pontibacterium sp.]